MRAFLSTLSPILLLLASCGGSDAPARSTVTSAPAPEIRSSGDSSSPSEVCVATFERQRACSDEFIARLVAARVAHDVPPGTAERDRTDGRETLVASALEEWKTDSTDEVIETSCARIVNQLPDGGASFVQEANACFEHEECSQFASCSVEMITPRWAR